MEMKTTREEIFNALEHLELAKSAALQLMHGVPAERSAQKPADGGWSAIQVYQHILFSEFGTLGYMQKKTSSGTEALDKISEQEQAAGQKLVDRLKSNERYAAPAILPEPDGNESLEAIELRWKHLRAELDTFVKGLDEGFYDRLVFKQPAAGMISLMDTLKFLTEHIHHHIPQLARLRGHHE
ncbi:MAG: DinB family protein [Flavobacteriales bacterium]